MFGGQVPPERKAELTEQIAAINPHVISVEGIAGIPGLIVNQIQGAFAAEHQHPTQTPTYTPDDRSIRLTLAGPHDVKVTQRAFATVQIDAGIHAFSITTER